MTVYSGALRLPIAASLLLHTLLAGALLVSWPQRRVQEGAASRISIRLLPAKPGAERGFAQPALLSPAWRPFSASRQPRPTPAHTPLPGARPSPAMPAAAPGPADGSAAATEQAAPQVPASALASALPAAREIEQSALLVAYRRQLGELFSHFSDYPRIAAVRGWEGEVRLRLRVARKGNLLGVALDQSSGFEVLDRHAMGLLEAQGNLPPLPEALEAAEIQVVVPIHYRLRKAT